MSGFDVANMDPVARELFLEMREVHSLQHGIEPTVARCLHCKGSLTAEELAESCGDPSCPCGPTAKAAA